MQKNRKIWLSMVLYLLWGNAIPIAARSHADTLANINKTDSVKAKRDTVLVNKPRQAAPAPDFTNVFMYDFFTTINAISYENAQTSDQHNEINFYYNTTINEIFKTKYFTYRAYMFNEYGIRYFIDSVTTKGQDRHEVKNSVQIPVKKMVNINLGFIVRSQLWKQHEYAPDSTQSDGVRRYLYTDYFSPGYVIYSGGISINFLKTATLDIGLVGGKTTKIKNQRIFEERGATKLYGLQKGEKKKLTYGINLQLNVPPHRLGKHFVWECYTTVYTPKEQLGRLKGYSVDASNVIHYIFLKNLRVSLRTVIKYDETINKEVFMMNMLSVGFYINNKF